MNHLEASKADSDIKISVSTNFSVYSKSFSDNKKEKKVKGKS